MEDILETYTMPYDPKIPLICMDEQPCQLLNHSQPPLPMKVGKVMREDYEYERRGTCSIFMFIEPLAGRRYVHARPRRTKIDWAQEIRELLEVHYPRAPKVRVVMDNLNTHTIASLYEAFEPEKALALARRLEIHYTPKHGSWLNMAEIELSALTLQCLNRRIGSIEELQNEIQAWSNHRNESCKVLNWRFTTQEARIHLKHLYPKFD